MKYREPGSGWCTRLIALGLLPLQLFNGNLVATIGALESIRSVAIKGTSLVMSVQHVNVRHVSSPRVTPSLTPLHFSDAPTDQDISGVVLGQEKLSLIGNKTTPQENLDLAHALTGYARSSSKEEVTLLTDFLAKYPQSGWTASILVNLGALYHNKGYYSRALLAWEKSWSLSKDETGIESRTIADRSAAELARLLSTLGRTERLKGLLDEIKGRKMYGTAATMISNAREALTTMEQNPGITFKCGPYALGNVQVSIHQGQPVDPLVVQSKSGTKGFSLTQLVKMAQTMKLNFQAAKREPSAKFIVPSVINWKSGHYAALIKQEGANYLVKDPTFGADRLLSKEALQDESSGYFLVPAGPLPVGWASVASSEADTVWGRGYEGPSPTSATTCKDKDTVCHGAGSPMTSYSIYLLLACLHLEDSPIRYNPPVGPAVRFTVGYNQYEMSQTGAFITSNLGNNWVTNWTSYVYQAHSPGASTTQQLVLQGGGTETYNGYTAITGGSYTGFYAPQVQGQQTLYVLPTTNPSRSSDPNQWRYERHEPDGSMEVYDSPSDSIGNVYLTKVIDPQGNAITLSYQSVAIGSQNDYRLASITDAIGQVTTLTYGFSDDPLKITKVTDPFGRYAQFAYTPVLPHQLVSITDPIGIQSSFTYLPGTDAISSLITPYGTTGFVATVASGTVSRSLVVTLPDGSQEKVLSLNGAFGLPTESAPTPPSPYTNFVSSTVEPQNEDTFYWDRKAMQASSTDYTKAYAYHWLVNSGLGAGPIVDNEKPALESRIWYNYIRDPSWNYPWFMGLNDKPIAVARLLSDSTTQFTQATYNSLGHPTQRIDARNRTTNYTYASNGIDLTQVMQVNSGGSDQIFAATYNSQHEPLTITDASGNTTTYTYNSKGQVHTVTNALTQTTTYNYNSNFYLTSVVGPTGTGTLLTLTYDSYGHVATMNDSQGYQLTYAYDNIDRVTSVTYPDSTTTQTFYQYLDPQRVVDRGGHLTRFFYNSLRQLVAREDPQGAVTNYQWCTCGALGSLTDANGHTTAWTRDLEGRATAKTYADGTATSYVFDTAVNRLTSMTDANSQTTSYTYWPDSTLKQTSYSGSTTATVNFTYDANYPRLATYADTVTGTTTLSYVAAGSNGAGKVASSAGPLATITYDYDTLNRLNSRNIDSANASGVTYDSLGRVLTETNLLTPSSQFGYAYLGLTPRPASMTNPNGQSTVYTYSDSATTSSEPRLSEIDNLNASSGVISKFDYQYDPAARITQWTQQADSGSPITWNYSYDPAGQLLGAVQKNSSGAPLNVDSYNYDFGGNRLSAQNNGTVISQTPNSVNELGDATVGGSLLWQGHADKSLYSATLNSHPATINNGTNFVASVPVTSGTNTVSVVAEDTHANISTNNFQTVVTGSGASAPTYDYNGNLSADALGNTYHWDVRNQLIAIVYNAGVNSGNHTEFSYNAIGQRVKIVERSGTTIGSGTVTSTKQFIFDQTQMAEERDASNAVTKRFYSQGEQISGTSYYYTRDHLGSVREMVDGSGIIQARYDYDPYGKVTKVSGSMDSDFEYAEYYVHRPSGLNLTLFRAYDPNNGTWLSRDPLPDAEISQGTNLYAYVRNNTIALNDPLGLCGGASKIPGGPRNNPNAPDNTPYLKILLGFEAAPIALFAALELLPVAAAGGATTITITAAGPSIATLTTEGGVATATNIFASGSLLPLGTALMAGAQDAGATTLIVETGPVVDEGLADALSARAASGAGFAGGSVAQTGGGLLPEFTLTFPVP